MNKLDRELKAILAKDDVKNLLEKCLASVADIRGIIVIVDRPNGKGRIYSTLNHVTTIAGLEIAKSLLIEEHLTANCEDTEG